jgi:hypothetical protein
MLTFLQNLGLGVLEAEGGDAGKAAGGKQDDNDDERSQDVLSTLMGREKVGAGVKVVEEQEDKSR